MKKGKLVGVIVACIVILVLLITAGLFLKNRLESYEQVVKYYTSEQYLLAYDASQELGDYRQSQKIHSKSAYQLALQQEDYNDAITFFEDVSDLQQDDSHYLNAIYHYVLDNPSQDDQKTLNYVDILLSNDYYGMDEVLATIYPWEVDVFAVNTSASDSYTSLTSIDRNDTMYFHYRLKGGPANCTTTLSYKIYFSTGSSVSSGRISQELESGAEDSISLYFRYPSYIQGGELLIEFFDAYGNSIGTGSVDITR